MLNRNVFTGNQIGVLLAEYLMTTSKKDHLAVITTVVSSRMLQAMNIN